MRFRIMPDVTEWEPAYWCKNCKHELFNKTTGYGRPDYMEHMLALCPYCGVAMSFSEGSKRTAQLPYPPGTSWFKKILTCNPRKVEYFNAPQC